MKIRCWGSRGSIPVSGPEYLKYGGDTTCIEIRNAHDDIIIIDAGTGIRSLGKALLAERRFHYHLLFTHSHWDHIMGFPFFAPIYHKATKIEMIGCPYAQDTIKSMVSQTMHRPNFPIEFQEANAHIHYRGFCQKPFDIGNMHITPILLSHPGQGLGYKFEENGRSFVFLTDNELTYKHEGGLGFDDYLEFCQGVDLLIHDSEFTAADYKTKRKWGHSIYTDSLDLALQAKVKHFGLFHHNQERYDDDVDQFVEDCQRIIAECDADLDCFGVASGWTTNLD